MGFPFFITCIYRWLRWQHWLKPLVMSICEGICILCVSSFSFYELYFQENSKCGLPLNSYISYSYCLIPFIYKALSWHRLHIFTQLLVGGSWWFFQCIFLYLLTYFKTTNMIIGLLLISLHVTLSCVVRLCFIIGASIHSHLRCSFNLSKHRKRAPY